ncbi:MAG: glutathione S-transferase family protein [Hyphomicrobiaceae bacterium]
MIELYTWMTDNGYKARQAAEESGLPYELKPVNIRNREQFAPDFLKLSPGHKIPALVDTDGPGGNRITLCESGAILKYLGDKAGNGLYPADPLQRIRVDQWLFYGSATFTTLAQQFGHFVVRWDQDVPKAKAWYTGVLKDMMATLDRHLADNEYMTGSYSVADISMYPDVHLHGVKDIGLGEYPNLKRWHDTIEQRPAVQRAWVPFA